jgi:hypothetical protein
MAFVVLGGESDEVQLIEIGEARSIDSLVEEWESASGLLPPEADTGETKARRENAGQALRAAIFDKMAAALHATQQFTLVPAGNLEHVSFENLPMENNGPVGNRFTIRYVRTVSDWILATSLQKSLFPNPPGGTLE